jgi:hypothetical protein
VVCSIRENELLVRSENYDVKQTANRFAVISPDASTLLELQLHAPNELRITNYRATSAGAEIRVGIERVPDESSLLSPDQTAVLVPRTVLRISTATSGWVFQKCSFKSPLGLAVEVTEDGKIQLRPLS